MGNTRYVIGRNPGEAGNLVPLSQSATLLCGHNTRSPQKHLAVDAPLRIGAFDVIEINMRRSRLAVLIDSFRKLIRLGYKDICIVPDLNAPRNKINI